MGPVWVHVLASTFTLGRFSTSASSLPLSGIGGDAKGHFPGENFLEEPVALAAQLDGVFQAAGRSVHVPGSVQTEDLVSLTEGPVVSLPSFRFQWDGSLSWKIQF